MRPARYTRGQSMVIMAVALLVLLGLGALIIDGGSIYVNRRRAQTAADAAAMAGAHAMCIEKGSLADIQAAANKYAVQENGATAVESVEVDGDGQVVVQTRVESPSFLGTFLGQPTDMARAEAAAGCFIPGGTSNMLPIAWTCAPPAGGGNIETCEIQKIPWDIFQDLMGTFDFNNDLLTEGDGTTASSYSDNTGGALTYLVMDSNSFDLAANCIELNPAGWITCDFDGDGVLNVEGGANRGWLLLDGTGASDLVDLMLNGYPGVLQLPHWLPGKDGVSNTVFINAHQIKGNVSLVPVFNAVCEDTTTSGLPTACADLYDSADLISGSSGNSTFYRVVGTAPFVVTCVSKGVPEPCPAKTLVGVDPNVSTIEGYFVDGYIAGDEIDPNGFDLGVYIISLTR